MSAWSNSTEVRIKCAGLVVQELGRLVEEGRVVLVALDHEVLAVALAEAAVEVEADAADEQRRIASGALQQLGDQIRRGGLAVGAATITECLSAMASS